MPSSLLDFMERGESTPYDVGDFSKSGSETSKLVYSYLLENRSSKKTTASVSREFGKEDSKSFSVRKGWAVKLSASIGVSHYAALNLGADYTRSKDETKGTILKTASNSTVSVQVTLEPRTSLNVDVITNEQKYTAPCLLTITNEPGFKFKYYIQKRGKSWKIRNASVGHYSNIF